MSEIYDEIGRGYTGRRMSDPRISAAIQSKLRGARSVLNIGAGTGSYESEDTPVIAVEPSRTMIAQRPENSAPVVQAVAEALPFSTAQFDLALGVLTLHHWQDWKQGLREAARVSGGNVLLLSWLGFRQHFWLTDYFPEIISLDRGRFPAREDYEDILGLCEVTPLPIPHDCQDGFLCAYWRRPEAYLDPLVRNSISTFSAIQNPEPALQKLESDIQSGAWSQKYGALLELDACDLGYCLLQFPVSEENS